MEFSKTPIMKDWLIGVATLAIAFCLLANGHPASAKEQQNALKYIVDTQWLNKIMKNNSNHIRILDVRSPAEYSLGHIPGASNFPVELSFEGHRIVSIKKIRSLLQHLGLKNTDQLILYDNGQIRDAAHVFWMLETYGHEQVVVLDGGLPAWQQAGLKLSTISTHYPPSQYIPTITPSHLTTKLGALLSLNNPNVTIIDSRQKDEYDGLTSRAQRAGHIPKALNISAEKLIDNNAPVPKLKTLDELQSLYKAVDKSAIVMSYCNRGKDSAMSYLIMRSLGYNASVYDGGWLEWGNDMQLPIEP